MVGLSLDLLSPKNLFRCVICVMLPLCVALDLALLIVLTYVRHVFVRWPHICVLRSSGRVGVWGLTVGGVYRTI